MDLESYRKAKKLTYDGLIEELHLDGMPRSRIRRIALGHIWPRPHVIRRIVKESRNAISVEAMFSKYAEQQGELAECDEFDSMAH